MDSGMDPLRLLLFKYLLIYIYIYIYTLLITTLYFIDIFVNILYNIIFFVQNIYYKYFKFSKFVMNSGMSPLKLLLLKFLFIYLYSGKIIIKVIKMLLIYYIFY